MYTYNYPTAKKINLVSLELILQSAVHQILSSYMKFLVIIVLCLVATQNTWAQELKVQKDTSYCIPTVTGMPRTKGIIIRQEQLLDYGIRSIAKDGSVANGEISSHSRWEFKMRLPIISKPGFALAAGFNYSREDFRFEKPQTKTYDSPLFSSIENKSLQSIGGTLYLVKPFRGNKYFLLRLSGDLNGDYNKDVLPTSHFLQFNIAPMFGWKRNENLSYGIGLTYGNVFGRNFISPVVSYNHTLNKHWGIEALLPSKVKLRYTLNDQTLLYASTELNGARYRVNYNSAAMPGQDVFMRRAAIRYLLTFEREIHDWLWFSLEAGMQSNINFTLSDKMGPARKAFINNQLNHAMLVGFSLFAVPPKKFTKRH